KGVVGPELRPQFLPAHHFSRTFEQQTQDLECLLSHLHFRPELAQLTGAQIERVGAEQGGSRGGHFHVRKTRGGRTCKPDTTETFLGLFEHQPRNCWAVASSVT